MLNVWFIERKRLYRWIVFGLILLCPSVQAGDIYRCIDDEGRHNFQDTPCDGQAKPYKRWHDQPKDELASSPTSTPEPVVMNLWGGQNTASLIDEGQAEHSFLWRATREGRGTVFLMGSIHFGTPDMYPLSSRVQSAFNDADVLLVELNALAVNPLAMGQVMAQHGMYQNGDSLKDHLSHEAWNKLQRAVEQLNIPISLLSAQKPWLAAMTLSALSMQQRGYSEALGVDMHFLKQAQGRKKIVELEGVEFQASLMANLPRRAQLAMLEDTLRILDEGDEYFDAMFDVWQRGDAAGMTELIEQSAEGSQGARELMKILLDDRNLQMFDKLSLVSTQNKTSFVVVGAAHLVGPKPTHWLIVML